MPILKRHVKYFWGPINTVIGLMRLILQWCHFSDQ